MQKFITPVGRRAYKACRLTVYHNLKIYNIYDLQEAQSQ